MKAKDYFDQCGIQYLKTQGIISDARGHKNILHTDSVEPLENDLKQKGISRIENTETGWYFTDKGNFHNKTSKEFRSGNWRDLKNPGAVFTGQNRQINPYYQPNKKVDDAFKKAQLEKAIKLIQEGLSILNSLN